MIGAFFAPFRGYLWPVAALVLALLLAASHGLAYRAGRAAIRSQWDARIAQDKIDHSRELLRAIDVGQKNTAAASDFLKRKTDDNAKNKTRALAAERGLASVLHSAKQCTDETVPAGPPPGSYDGADPRWQLERGRVQPD